MWTAWAMTRSVTSFSPVVPPTAAVLKQILSEAESFRHNAPFLPEAIEFSEETGVREGELFNLTWWSIDYALGPHREGGIRIEEQTKERLVGGKRWVPKSRRSRIVPLSPRAREILDRLRGDAIPRADTLVIPNEHGCPYLAHQEGVIDKPPRVELLPEDDASPVVPPTDAVLNEILAEAEKLRHVAPLLPEAIELSVETGLRESELFNLRWASIDYALGPNREGGIRVEEQGRGRMVGGKRWVPKSRRSRIVPLSPRAREILDRLRGHTIPRADALVIPNQNGCPYLRLQTAEKGSGTSTWRVMKEAMGHDVRWHDLRHVFAVRCLSAGIDISTVSRWLGHSDINLTVKRYGRFAADSHEQWVKIARVSRVVTWAGGSAYTDSASSNS